MYVELRKSQLFYQDTKDKNVRLYRLTKYAEDAARRGHQEKDADLKDDTLLWTDKDFNRQTETSYDYDESSNLLIIKAENELGDFTVYLPVDLKLQIQILEHTVKVVNKMKAAMESMK